MTTASIQPNIRTASDDAVVLRPAHPADDAALRRLAALDSKAPLSGEVLVAVRDGDIAAALEMGTGNSIADPFLASAWLVDLLRTRAALLRGPALRRRRRALPLLRRARQAA